MASYRTYFKGKKVTVLGLGLLGKLIGDIQFLSKQGAVLTVTDLKTRKELAPSLKLLKDYKNITYVLGKHQYKDFENRDFILKGQGTRLDSPYILHARKNKIPIEMDEVLFLKLAPPLHCIGITGTRGKTYTTELIYHILKKAGKRVHLGGNIKGTAALPLLSKVKKGDYVVFELSSWQLQGFGEAKISPQTAVFTSFMPDHMNYYDGNLKEYFKDKSYIFSNQKEKDILVVRPDVLPLVKGRSKSKILLAKKSMVSSWKINTPGEHMKENTACAVLVARTLGISEVNIKKAVENFKGVSGRLELVKKYKGIQIYNDTTATTPEATTQGLESLATQKKKVILIAGGTDKKLDPKILGNAISKYVKHLFLLSGSGTEKLKRHLTIECDESKNLKALVASAIKIAKRGDIILFSPGFSSFELFKNEYDRGEQFVRIIKNLK